MGWIKMFIALGGGEKRDNGGRAAGRGVRTMAAAKGARGRAGEGRGRSWRRTRRRDVQVQGSETC